ncbi:MAG: glycosyltransferase family protein [bacterium]
MKNIKVITVVQARMSSTRLPGKVMLLAAGKPLLLLMIERMKQAVKTGKVIVATSTNYEDDAIEKLCVENKIDFFRGHPTDLLDRHYWAGKKLKADAVVKIPSDCPLIDPKIIDRVIDHYITNFDEYDYVSNLHPATYPDGNDVEIMSFEALKTAWENANQNFEREHTTPYIWTHPEMFKIGNIKWEANLDYSTSHRWTIDYEEDYLFIKKVFEELYPVNPKFSMVDILNLLWLNPAIANLNSKYIGRYWYENHLDELTNIEEYRKKIKV